jgi:hypothetical protein
MQEKFDELAQETIDEEEFIADFAISAAADLLETLSDFEYDVMDNPKSAHDIILIIESIRGIMYRIRGEEYPMHTFSDRMFEEIVGDEVNAKEFLANFIEQLDFS